jgi:hypothetical protein
MITEGKWQVSSSTIVCDEQARIIANCCPAGVPSLDVCMEEAIDNAKLIAASKDLLEASRNAVKYMADEGLDLIELRQAIAKAEN